MSSPHPPRDRQHAPITHQDLLVEAFENQTGAPPLGIWAAPGRVNLIGEHTDYNDGFVMPFALAQQVTIAAAPRSDELWSVSSINTGTTETFGPADLQPGMDGWQAYVAGVVWALRESGHQVAGADLVLNSDVPIGAGLSSSAALECATLTTLVELNSIELALLDRAKLARRCENEFVGAPTGLMDQAASTLCTADHALFFDCRTFETRQVPLALGDQGLALLVLDTKTPHALVDSEYATRRASCEEASRILGVKALRDVSDLNDALTRLSDPVMQRRVRHVVTENARVLQAVEVLEAGDFRALGPLLDASHASMRDDFEITVPTVDLAVEAAREAGAIGARMTGGGFGGCIIALVPHEGAERVAAHIYQRFAESGFGQPMHFLAAPAAGARRIR
ncbi:galactokinase [Microlunatus panaciterrae]|uniref:Galactokinase n=1 Tax=Microlunatus panaciterrae TaxID=400768 RepID=A0ABS2RFV4_9ACTN|nr:galactokinase [Microlunatus panaciterrae]MBM7797422.1 galactokinase [Microlunatus panaciterrae]